MFAPRIKVSTARTVAPWDSTSLSWRRTVVERRFDDGPSKQTLKPAILGRTIAGRELRREGWDFTKIPVFHSEGMSRLEKPSLAPMSLLPIHAKVNIGAVNDPLEHNAEQVAQLVMRMPEVTVTSTPPQVNGKCAACEEEKEKLRKKPAGSQATPGEMPSIVHEVLSSPGRPLDAATRRYFEPRFGYEFSPVRVHTDERAADAARGLAAQAFTAGDHIVFAEGHYAPDSVAGLHLLAHELAHVVQQAPAVSTQKSERILQCAPDKDADVSKRSGGSVGPHQGQDFGLQESAQVLKFAVYAVSFLRNAPDKSPKDLVEFLVQVANNELTALGVPTVNNYELTKLRDLEAAKFIAKEWKLEVDLESTLKRPVKSVGNMSFSEAANLAATIYHEFRHAEQTFRIAQLLSQKEHKTASQIAAANSLEVPITIAKKAVDSSAVMPSDPASIENIEGWREFEVGGARHLKYKGTVLWLLNEIAKALVTDPIRDKHIKNLTPADHKALDEWTMKLIPTTIPDWRVIFHQFVETKLKELEKMGSLTKVDEDVKERIGKLIFPMTSLFQTAKELGELKKKQNSDPNEILIAELKINSNLTELYLALYEDYRNFADEADAFATESAIKNEMAMIYTVAGGIPL
jgi:Domain of unknown function (DUF4157)